MTLDELARKHGTDKHDGSHSFAGESYLDVYERYLGGLRDLPINLLELGVREGRSLRMWKEYFPKARIFGVDFDPDCKAYEEDRIEILIASQHDEARLTELAQRADRFHVILDDASHINHLTRASFDILFPHLSPGGIYIIEDLGMSWVDHTKEIDNPDYMYGVLKTHTERGISIEQTRDDIDQMFRKILYEMDMNRGDVEFVHFWSKLAIVRKTLLAE